MKLSTLLTILGLAVLVAASPTGRDNDANNLVPSTTLTLHPSPAVLTTIPYTAHLACEIVFSTSAPCSIVTSQCVLPASTTVSFTVLLNGTTTSGVVCVPTWQLSTKWAPHETRTRWTAGADAAAMGTVHDNGHREQANEKRVPPPEWFSTRRFT